jgi:hypothetical protein
VISGPDSVAIGQTAIYRLILSHGPAQTGGCDIASYHGIIDTFYQDFHTLQRDTVRNELTHRFPKYFIADSVYWTFKYIAPSIPQIDTLYADGNSTNADFVDDTFDHWNFAMNKPIRVYRPIGIKPISNSVPDNFRLFQNYPNPFNPYTIINFQLLKNSEVKLVVYDMRGREVTTLVNEKKNVGTYQVGFDGSAYSSGIYFYKFETEYYTETRKMMLIK